MLEENHKLQSDEQSLRDGASHMSHM